MVLAPFKRIAYNQVVKQLNLALPICALRIDHATRFFLDKPNLF